MTEGLAKKTPHPFVSGLWLVWLLLVGLLETGHDDAGSCFEFADLQRQHEMPSYQKAFALS